MKAMLVRIPITGSFLIEFEAENEKDHEVLVIMKEMIDRGRFNTEISGFTLSEKT